MTNGVEVAEEVLVGAEEVLAQEVDGEADGVEEEAGSCYIIKLTPRNGG